MRSRLLVALGCLTLSLLSGIVAPGHARAKEQVWQVSLQDGATIQVLVGQPKSSPPRAALVLLAGGDGRLKLGANGQPTRMKNNFLVRTRHLLHQSGYVTALLDAPSDRQMKPGLLAGYRATQRHAVRDIGTVVDLLVGTFRLPVIVVGTSRGAVSAVNAARRLHGKLAGAGLTAAITQPNRRGATINAVMLDSITLPTLFVHHVNDNCPVTPLHGARSAFEVMQKAGLAVRWGRVSGGRDSKKVCGGRSYHGFWQSEGQALGHLTTWLTKILAARS